MGGEDGNGEEVNNQSIQPNKYTNNWLNLVNRIDQSNINTRQRVIWVLEQRTDTMFPNKTQIVQLNDSEWMRLLGRRVYKGRRRSRIRSGRRRKFFYDQIFISKLTECRPCSSLPLEIWNKNVNIYYLMTLAVISSLVLSSRCASRWQSRPRLGGN